MMLSVLFHRGKGGNIVESLSTLGPKIAREQDAQLLRASPSDFAKFSKRPRGSRVTWFRWTIGLCGFLLGIVAVTVLVVFVKQAFARLTYQIRSEANGTVIVEPEPGKIGRWVAAAGRQRTTIDFSDGSKAVLADNARLRIADLSRDRADLALEQGTVDLTVDGNRPEEYRILVGPFELSLLSGRAQASWDPMTLQLELIVHQGYVVIAGCQFGDGRSVAAGKELGARCSEP
jgi:hypothetical protein